MKLLISIGVTILISTSCGSSEVKPVEYSESISDFKIDKSLNYNQVLTRALGLDDAVADKVKKILATYRKNRKKTPDKEEQLRKNREKKLERILSPTQLKQRKYVNAIYYESIPDYPGHPANIQRIYKLSDGQVLKLIEIEEIFKEDKNIKLRNERLVLVLGAKNADLYRESKGLAI